MNRSKFFLRCEVDGLWFDYEAHSVPFWDLAVIIFNDMIKNNFYSVVELWETDIEKTSLLDTYIGKNPLFKGEILKSQKNIGLVINMRNKRTKKLLKGEVI